MHQAACLLNPIGEMFLIKGAARGHQANHSTDLVPQVA
jgi:hypothetical protein